jgi:hypothetical protein
MHIDHDLRRWPDLQEQGHLTASCENILYAGGQPPRPTVFRVGKPPALGPDKIKEGLPVADRRIEDVSIQQRPVRQKPLPHVIPQQVAHQTMIARHPQQRIPFRLDRATMQHPALPAW